MEICGTAEASLEHRLQAEVQQPPPTAHCQVHSACVELGHYDADAVVAEGCAAQLAEHQLEQGSSSCIRRLCHGGPAGLGAWPAWHPDENDGAGPRLHTASLDYRVGQAAAGGAHQPRCMLACHGASMMARQGSAGMTRPSALENSSNEGFHHFLLPAACYVQYKCKCKAVVTLDVPPPHRPSAESRRQPSRRAPDSRTCIVHLLVFSVISQPGESRAVRRPHNKLCFCRCRVEAPRKHSKWITVAIERFLEVSGLPCGPSRSTALPWLDPSLPNSYLPAPPRPLISLSDVLHNLERNRQQLQHNLAAAATRLPLAHASEGLPKVRVPKHMSPLACSGLSQEKHEVRTDPTASLPRCCSFLCRHSSM